jgi:hypothetical protein
MFYAEQNQFIIGDIRCVIALISNIVLAIYVAVFNLESLVSRCACCSSVYIHI